MKLLMDIGNSRLKWTVENKGCLRRVESLDYRQDDFLSKLTQQWQAGVSPTQIAIASVSGKPILNTLTDFCKNLWPDVVPIVPISSACAFGVTSAYQAPEKLGVDRWLALIAAHRHYVGDICVIDCGTAITVDALQSDGKHLGGLICPGLIMMKKSLASNTADLSFNAQTGQTGLAAETSAAIANGVLTAVLGLINQVMQGFNNHYQLVLTGGDAEIVAQSLAMPSILDRELVLKGLSIYCAGEQTV